jgi:hypothetical protein
MRRLPPFDPRVVEMQVDVMTGFLREVRDAIRRKRPGAELHMRVCKPYPLMGCDPGRWAREGVVDGVVIEHRSFEPREADLPGLVEALRGTACLPGAAFTRTTWAAEKAPMHPYRIEKQAQKYLAQGARIIGFYETACVIPYPEFCRAVRAIKDPAAMPSRVV